MNDDKWAGILDRIQSQFEILEQGEEKLADVPNGKAEFIVFESPMGKIRLERLHKPKVIDKKTIGGSKYGASTGVEYIYSDTEQVKTFQAFKEVDGEWEPVDAEGFGG